MADIPDISPRTVLLRYNLRVGDNTPEIGVVSSAIWGPDASFLRATRGPFPNNLRSPGKSGHCYLTYLKTGVSARVYLQSFRNTGAPGMSVSMQGMALRYS